MNTNNQHDYDSGLVKLIQLLRETPERDAQVVESRKEQFLSELEDLFAEQPAEAVSGLRRLFLPRKNPSRQVLRPRLAFSALLAALLLAVFLFGGAGVTVYAAQSALPGDSLYAVKSRLERTRLSLTANDYQLASIQLSLAHVRLDEIEGLIREKRFRQVSETTRQFESHLAAAIEAMRRLAEKDPERASQIANQITLVLNRYTQVLSKMLADLPLEVKTEVEDTISNSPVLRKVSESNENANGNENENEARQENENEASNDNQNDNDNANENEARNENLNDNGKSQDDTKSLKDFSFIGFVESMSAQEWRISGIRVAVNAATRIDANIKAGDRVEVKGQYISGQTAQASEIRLRKTDRQENTNDRQTQGNENDNGANENERQNENRSGNQNENVNQNQNDNSNDNDKDDTNDNDKDDSNDNDND